MFGKPHTKEEMRNCASCRHVTTPENKLYRPEYEESIGCRCLFLHAFSYILAYLHSSTNSTLAHLTLLQDRKSSSLQLRVLEYKERAGSVDKIVSSGSQA